MRQRQSVLVVVGVLLVLGVAPPAVAKAPGSNGRLAFDTDSGVIWTANADGSGLASVPIDVYGSGVPRWSPDGSRLLVGSFTNLGLRPALVAPDGTGLSVLAVPGLPTYMDIGPCVWVPPGDRILCTAQNFTTADHSLDGIYSMTTAGFDPRRLTVNPYPPAGAFGGGDLVGDVSPDGQQFVFMRARPDPGHPPGREQSGALYVESVDGTGLREITDYGLPNSHGDGFESWSPDGSRMVFGSATGALFTIHPDGTGLASVPVRAAGGRTFAAAPAWSPDGTRIVTRLYLGSVGRSDIYTLRADGSDLTRVTPSDIGFTNDPDWGPN